MNDKNIPLIDLAANSRSIKQDVLDAVSELIDSSQFILGKQVELFEEEFAEFSGTSHGVGVANGTEALHLAMRGLGIGPGDEVITAGNSFAATPYAVAHAGATPVFVDVDPVDYCIDVELIEQAITPRTKAIVPVHLYGQMAKMDRINDIAERHGLKVVEDAAQAHGAELAGRRAGSWGDAGCFSFYPGKNLGAFGDGGAIVTDQRDLVERLLLLRNYGQKSKNEHTMLGFNSRLDTLQAAVLLVKLSHLEKWTEQRRQVAAWYAEALADCDDVILPQARDDVRHVYHLYVVRHRQRDALLAHLKHEGIYCGVHYPKPLHRASPFVNCRTVPNGLPVCTQLAEEIISLPMYPELSRDDVGRVAESVRSFNVQPAAQAGA